MTDPSDGKRQHRWAALAVLVCAAAIGCRSSESRAPGGSEGEGSALSALGAAGAAPEEGAPGGVASKSAGPIRVSPESIERFISYQKDALARTRATLADGGKTVERRFDTLAAAEAEAQRKSGLSPEELRSLEGLVGDVLARRAVAKATNPELVHAQLLALQEKLAQNQQTTLQPMLEALEGDHQRTTKLAEERARHGDANVDAVLAHEAELTELWEARLALMLGRESSRPAP